MQTEKLKQLIVRSKNLIFFGGAGVSTDSGIPDFRSADGLYSDNMHIEYPPEVILSRTFFYSHTGDFFKFYKTRMVYLDAKPNDAHLSLAALEKQGILKSIITQNIDGLHQTAGSQNVTELHGSVHRNYCENCRKFFSLSYIMESAGTIPQCDVCGGVVKPDVVLYEEALSEEAIYNSVNTVSKADTLIAGGTSLAVYPAAGLLRYFKGKNLIIINKSSTPYDHSAALVINDSLGKVLKSVLD